MKKVYFMLLLVYYYNYKGFSQTLYNYVPDPGFEHSFTNFTWQSGDGYYGVFSDFYNPINTIAIGNDIPDGCTPVMGICNYNCILPNNEWGGVHASHSGDQCLGLFLLNGGGASYGSQWNHGEVKIQLNQTLQAEKDYVLDFWMAKMDGTWTTDGNPNLKISLGNGSNISNEIPLFDENVSNDGTVGNQNWQHKTVIFRLQDSKDHILLRMDDYIGVFNFWNKKFRGIYLDDVSIYDYCYYINPTNLCKWTIGPMFILSNPSYIPHDYNAPWQCWFSPSATHFQVEFTDAVGNHVRYFHFDCPESINGQYLFDGKNDSGSEIAAGNYHAHIEISDDCNSLSATRNFVKVNSTVNPTITPPGFGNCSAGNSSISGGCSYVGTHWYPLYTDCCVYDLTLSNLTFQQSDYFSVIHDITLGSNITIADNVSLTLNAGHAINIVGSPCLGTNSTITQNFVSCRTGNHQQEVITDTLKCPIDTLRFILSKDTTLHYHWDFGNGQTSDADSVNIYYDSSATYTITLYTEEFGTDKSFQMKYYVPDCGNARGSNKIFHKTIPDFSIDPNPSNGIFQFYNLSASSKNILIYDTEGRKIYQSEVIEKSFTIDLTKHPAGIYFVKIESGDKTTFDKIVIQ